MADADDIAARVIIYAPGFTDDARIPVFVADAIAAHTKTAWGAVYISAMAYYVAHVLFMADREDAAGSPPEGGGTGSAAGAVTSRSAGDVSESYGNAASAVSGGVSVGDADLMQSTHGRAFLRERNKRAAARGRIVNVGGV